MLSRPLPSPGLETPKSRQCCQINGIPYIFTPHFPKSAEHHSASPVLNHSGYAKEASPESLGLVSSFGTSPITLWFLQCPRMAANHQQSITRARCHCRLSPWVSVPHFSCVRNQCCSWGGGELGGIQPCPTVATQDTSPHHPCSGRVPWDQRGSVGDTQWGSIPKKPSRNPPHTVYGCFCFHTACKGVSIRKCRVPV